VNIEVKNKVEYFPELTRIICGSSETEVQEFRGQSKVE